MAHINTSYPFYAHPMGRKRSVQIIKEAKAEIKKMESKRPSTPFGRKNLELGSSSDLQINSRPSSSTSIKSLKYHQEDVCAPSSRKLSPLNNMKVNEGDCTDIKLEPIVNKSVLRTQKHAASPLKSHIEAEFMGFPPITYDDKGNAVKNIHGNSGKPEDEAAFLNNEFPVVDSCRNFISPDTNSLDENQNCETSFISSNRNTTQDSEESVVLRNTDENSEDDVSKELMRFFPILEKSIKLGKKKNEEDMISIVCNIYSLLKKRNAFEKMYSHRIPLLKLLFKLLDSNFPILSLHTIKLLLDMKIKDKNLSSIFRLLLRLINHHHINLNEYQLTENLLEAIQTISVSNNKDAAYYGMQIIQTLILRNKIEVHFTENCAIILLHHLKELNIMLSREKNHCDDICNQLITQIISCLHYLVNAKEVWKLLLRSENLIAIMKALNFYFENPVIVQIIVRLISKIVDEVDGCQAVSQCPEDLLLTFILILQKYPYDIDVILQTTFIIEKLVSVDETTAVTFVTSDFISTLANILDGYVKQHLQVKTTIPDIFKDYVSVSGDRDWHQDIFEVIIKILNTVANICLSPKAGYHLAEEHFFIIQLLNFVAAYMKKDGDCDSSLPLYYFLAVINNISYYLSSSSEIYIKLAERVVPLLDDSFAFDVRLQAAKITQNLTRSSEIRQYIHKHSLLPAFIRLLGEGSKEFDIPANGIIMNLLRDDHSRQVFYEEQGVTKILNKLHLCADRDWNTSAKLCQILWNHCCGEDTQVIPISKIEAQHLIKFLSYSLNKKEFSQSELSDSQLAWKNEFYPVARNLLQLLQTKSPVVP